MARRVVVVRGVGGQGGRRPIQVDREGVAGAPARGGRQPSRVGGEEDVLHLRPWAAGHAGSGRRGDVQIVTTGRLPGCTRYRVACDAYLVTCETFNARAGSYCTGAATGASALQRSAEHCCLCLKLYLQRRWYLCGAGSKALRCMLSAQWGLPVVPVCLSSLEQAGTSVAAQWAWTLVSPCATRRGYVTSERRRLSTCRYAETSYPH